MEKITWLVTASAQIVLAIALVRGARWRKFLLLSLNHAISIAGAASVAWMYFDPKVTDAVYHPWKVDTDNFCLLLFVLVLYERRLRGWCLGSLSFAYLYCKFVDADYRQAMMVPHPVFFRGWEFLNIAILVLCICAVCSVQRQPRLEIEYGNQDHTCRS